MPLGLRFKSNGGASAAVRRLAIIATVVLTGAAGPAVAAPTQFAQFTTNGANDATNGLRWTNTENAVATFDTASGGAAVSFSFTNLSGLAPELQGPQAARLQFSTGTNVDGQTLFGQLNQPLSVPISIVITRDVPASVGNNGKQNLLTVTVTPNASMSLVTGQNGSASLNASSPGQTVTFSSDFYDFSNVSLSAMGLTLSGIVPGLSFNSENGGMILNSFTAAAIGSFTADLTAVPEPASLALVGIGGVILGGARLRAARRRQ